MSSVIIRFINVLNNPSRFTSPIQFEISFECMNPIKEDLEWILTYVGAADTTAYDQQLYSVSIGPLSVGAFTFVLEASPPDPQRIPSGDILGVTILLLSCHYKKSEFVRVGYYVNNEYDTKAMNDAPPSSLQIDRVVRTILQDSPRCTAFNISWDDESPDLLPPPPSDTTGLIAEEEEEEDDGDYEASDDESESLDSNEDSEEDMDTY